MSYARRVRLTVAAAAVIALSQAVYSQHNAYQTIDNYFRLPEGRKLGSTAGITIDRDGTSVWVFERCGAQNCVGSNMAPILKFDASGKLVKSFGAGMLVRPHGIHVDREGSVWVTDGEGPDGKDPNRNGKGHQVLKFSPDGKVLMTLGKAGIAGDGPDTFNQPSAVLVAPNGEAVLTVSLPSPPSGKTYEAWVADNDVHAAGTFSGGLVRLTKHVASGDQVMVTLERSSTEHYTIETSTTPLSVVANQQKRVPREFINPRGNGLTSAFTDYARPLIGGPLPDFTRL